MREKRSGTEGQEGDRGPGSKARASSWVNFGGRERREEAGRAVWQFGLGQ